MSFLITLPSILTNDWILSFWFIILYDAWVASGLKLIPYATSSIGYFLPSPSPFENTKLLNDSTLEGSSSAFAWQSYKPIPVALSKESFLSVHIAVVFCSFSSNPLKIIIVIVILNVKVIL